MALYEIGGFVADAWTHDRVAKMLAAVPNGTRAYTVASGEGLSVGDLTTLAQAGLPHRREGDALLFDRHDLVTASTYLGRPTGRRHAMRLWLRTAARVNAGPRRYALLSSLNEPLQEVVLGPSPDALPVHIAQFLEQYQSVRHVIMPGKAAENRDVFDVGSIANCVSFARWIVDDAARIGMSARFAWGAIVTAPFCTAHAWPEFEIEGRWIAVDMHMARALRTWGLSEVDPARSAMQLGAITVGTGAGFEAWRERRSESIPHRAAVTSEER